jgi:hypothetical protein
VLKSKKQRRSERQAKNRSFHMELPWIEPVSCFDVLKIEMAEGCDNLYLNFFFGGLA